MARMTPSDRGTNVKLCMGWLFNVLFLSRPLSLPPARHSSDERYFGAGSPNMKLLYSLVWCVYELLSNGKFSIHYRRLTNYMENEKKCHGHGEVLSPSHIQLWLAGYAVALYIAERFMRSNLKHHVELRSGLAYLQSLALEWLQVEYSLYEICEINRTPEERKKDPNILTEVYTCGGRSYKGRGESKRLIAINPVRGKFLYAVRTGLLVSKPNKTDLAALAISELSSGLRDKIRNRPLEYPPMWGKMTAERFEGGYFYIKFDDVTPTKDFAQSAGVDESGRWIEVGVDNERIEGYEKYGAPVMSAFAERSIIPDIEAGRRGKEDR